MAQGTCDDVCNIYVEYTRQHIENSILLSTHRIASNYILTRIQSGFTNGLMFLTMLCACADCILV